MVPLSFEGTCCLDDEELVAGVGAASPAALPSPRLS